MKKIFQLIVCIIYLNRINAQQTAIILTYPQYNNFTQDYYHHLFYVSSGSYLGSTHFGKDIKGSLGSEIKALASGIVVEKFNLGAHSGMGNGVRIKYPGIGFAGQDLYGLYLHLNAHAAINENDFVSKGQVIGYMGNSGTDLVHCHFELRYFSTLLSPFNGGSYSCNEQNIYQCGHDYEHPDWAINWENPESFIVNENKVSLLAPINNAQVNSSNINFTWNPLANATAFYIQISTTSTFFTTVIDESLGNVTSKTYSLQPNTEYFWRVRSNLTTDFDANDEVRRLLTIPAPPTLLSPDFGASNVSYPIVFDWEDVDGANAYRIQVAESPQLLYEQYSGPYVLDYPSTGTLTQSSYTWSGAQTNKTYYWRVRVNTNKGTSLYKARSFSTGIYNSQVGNSQMHYWFDNGALNSMQIDNDAEVLLPTGNLNGGYHSAFFYFTDNTGQRSSITRNDFFKSTGTSSQKIMEYWFDNAFENRQTNTVTDFNNINLSLSTEELDLGPHNLYYRFQTVVGSWSSVSASSFTKNTTASGTTKMEYWFNNDFDGRVTTMVTNLNAIDENISTDGVPPGTNILYTRFQKANGYWSSVTATSFVKGETGSNGWQYQYWVDSTLGFATTINIADAGSIDLDAGVNNADTGWHIICSRFRRNNGLWSSVTADSFYKATGPATTPCVITNSPGGEDSLATHFLCYHQIILNNQDGIINQNKLRRKDLAKITYRALVGTGTPEPVTLANYLPSLFGDLQTSTTSNEYYFNAAKFLSYIDYGDGIPPFNPSRLNFHPEDTIVRGYTLKVLLEAWNIKPDATLASTYLDVTQGTEVYGYIAKAEQMGLIKHGNGFANFRPYEAVTRAEAFVMLYRLLQLSSRPGFTDADFHIPFNRNELVGNNPSIGEGNFSGYGETPFAIKGVPSLSFSFNYNAAGIEVPDEGVKGRDDNGNLAYDQQNLGVGWNHNYNNYILVDKGITASNNDDRFIIMWSGGNVQVYNPTADTFVTRGVYDVLTKDAFNPSFITIKTKSQVTYRFEKLGINTGILHLVSVKDRHNNTVSLTYENGFGINIKRLKEVDDSHSRKIEFAYLDNTNLLDSVSANAGGLHKAVSFQYAGGRLVKYNNPKNDPTFYNYSAAQGQQYLLTKIVMPKGNIITNKYSAGNKLTSTDVNGMQQTLIQTQATHTATNSTTDIIIKSITNGVMLEQQIRNNKYSMPVAASGPNYKTVMEYTDAANPLLPTKVKDSLTDVEVIPVYGSNGNLLSITKRAAGIFIKDSMEYNLMNDVVKKIDPKGNITSFHYNIPWGQLTQINAPNGVITRIFPNPNGTVDSISNPSAIGTKFMYDAYGNLVQTRMPLGITSQAENDAYGRLLRSINAANISTNYMYDAHDNMMQESFDTVGLNIITQYRFDKNDNLIEVENAKGNITYLTYNNNDQLVKEQFGTAMKQYQYSDDGRLKKFINPNGVQFLNQFNDKDLLVNDGYATYNYYVDNSLQSINRNGKAITYTYDALKRITAVNYNDFAGNTVGYLYDDNNNITRITYPGGMVVNYEYDENNRLANVKDGAGANWATYSYLLDGRLATQTNRNNTKVKYFYDAAGRMDSTVIVKSDGSIIAAYGFELDVLGNHKKEIFNQPFMQTPPALGDSIAYTYSNTNRLLTKNTDSYTYDNNGNLTGITKNTGAVNYNYDVKNNLLQYNADGNTITYEYDGLGQRRKRNNTRYVLDNAYNVLMETDASGNPQYYYVHGLGMIARVKASTGQPYYYHHDFRGSTAAITNSSQTITHKYQYGAFGEIQQVQEEDFNAYRYVGKYGVGYESKDLTFMRARYYQPSVGRFNSEDPVWGVNLYPYGNNNSLRFKDPMGNVSVELNKRTGKLSLNLSLKEKWKLLMGTDVDFSTKIGDLKKDLKVLEDFKTILDYDFKTREQRIEYLQKFLNTANEYTKGLITPIMDVLADNAIINGVKRAAIIVQATELGDATGDLETMFNYLNAQLSKISEPK